ARPAPEVRKLVEHERERLEGPERGPRERPRPDPERPRHAPDGGRADRRGAAAVAPRHAPVDREPEIADVEAVPIAGRRPGHLVEEVVRHEAAQDPPRRPVPRVGGETLLFPGDEPRDVRVRRPEAELPIEPERSRIDGLLVLEAELIR